MYKLIIKAFKFLMFKISFFFRIKYLKREKHVLISLKAQIDKGTYFEGNNYIYRRVNLQNSYIGYGSYIAENTSFQNVDVGRFSSIGPNVKMIIGQHPTNNFVTTHPAFFSLQKQAGFTYATSQLFNEYRFTDEKNRISIKIGNDVWIGSDVLIMEGVSIGDGAIVAAGALVINNIPPYAIVGGVPAKLIRYRFVSEDIDYLLRLKWWDKDEAWIRSQAESFKDIKLFRIIAQDE